MQTRFNTVCKIDLRAYLRPNVWVNGLKGCVRPRRRTLPAINFSSIVTSRSSFVFFFCPSFPPFPIERGVDTPARARRRAIKPPLHNSVSQGVDRASFFPGADSRKVKHVIDRFNEIFRFPRVVHAPGRRMQDRWPDRERPSA